MDRVSFLRSLNFLRPLPPSVWDGSASNIDDNSNDNNVEDVYSGSTISPPTPSKNNAILLFDESLFVASIKPKLRIEKCVDNLAESVADTLDGSRKRGRGASGIVDGSTVVGPAFFQCSPAVTGTKPETCDKDKCANTPYPTMYNIKRDEWSTYCTKLGRGIGVQLPE